MWTDALPLQVMHSGGSGPFRDLSPSQQLERVRLLKEVTEFLKYTWQVRLVCARCRHTLYPWNYLGAVRIDSRGLAPGANA